MSINRWMDREAVVYIHNGILLSHKRNTFESVLMRWMNLEPKWSPKEKKITYIYAYMWNLERWHWWIYLQGSNGEGNGTPLQYSCLENPMDRRAWLAAVYGVTQSRTWLSDFIFTFHFHALEKEMATHSSVVAWRIPGRGEPGGLPSMGSHRVRHDWSDLAAMEMQT